MELVEAAGEGDVSKVQELLDQGINVNYTLPETQTPLIAAVQNGHFEVVKLLLDRGATLDAVESQTTLHIAVFRGNKEITQLLLDRGVEVEATLRNGATALHVAIFVEDNLEIVKLLLDRGAAVNAAISDGETPLLIASVQDDVNAAQTILDRGAAVDAACEEGRTALHWWAAAVNNLGLARLLLDWGAPIDAADKAGWTALHVALSFGHAAVVLLLLKRMAAINLGDKLGHSLLHFVHRIDIIDALEGEAFGWRRVGNFVRLLHAGGFSSRQWSVRLRDSSPSDEPSSSHSPLLPLPLSASASAEQGAGGGRRPPAAASRQLRSIFHNRDLCRIISAFIPAASRLEDFGRARRRVRRMCGENSSDDPDLDGDDDGAATANPVWRRLQRSFSKT